MKKLLILCALIAGILSGEAQTVIDNFTVGPYIVDYIGQGDVKYRLRDNIDLYEYFELKRDTVIDTELFMKRLVVGTPIKRAIQISGYIGANRFAAKEFGLSGVWKQNVGTNLYFNGGISLNDVRASLYGSFGITPTVYSTMSVKTWQNDKYVEADKDLKKSGFLIAPSLEFGGNIPVSGTIMRIGVYGIYKINCTTNNYDVYKQSAGRCFLGAKIGVVL